MNGLQIHYRRTIAFCMDLSNLIYHNRVPDSNGLVVLYRNAVNECLGHIKCTTLRVQTDIMGLWTLTNLAGTETQRTLYIFISLIFISVEAILHK